MPKQMPKLGILQLLVLLFSVYCILALVLEHIFALSIETEKILYLFDNIACAVFLIDFLVRFKASKDKWHFMRWGWIDLLSSLPNFVFMRLGLVVRIVRLVRILRAFKSSKALIDYFLRNKLESAFSSAFIFSILMVLFSSLAILSVEHQPNSNIKTAEDALWWAFVTISTVGYGDKYPITTEGRVIAVFLILSGMGLMGTFTGYIASWFVKIETKEEEK
jgi:voltage-gated potassium channel